MQRGCSTHRQSFHRNDTINRSGKPTQLPRTGFQRPHLTLDANIVDVLSLGTVLPERGFLTLCPLSNGTVASL